MYSCNIVRGQEKLLKTITSLIIHPFVIFPDLFFVIFGTKNIYQNGNTAKTKGQLFAVLTSETYRGAVTSVIKQQLPVFSPMSNPYKIVRRRRNQILQSSKSDMRSITNPVRDR